MKPLLATLLLTPILALAACGDPIAQSISDFDGTPGSLDVAPIIERARTHEGSDWLERNVETNDRVAYDGNAIALIYGDEHLDHIVAYSRMRHANVEVRLVNRRDDGTIDKDNTPAYAVELFEFRYLKISLIGTHQDTGETRSYNATVPYGLYEETVVYIDAETGEVFTQ